MFPCIPLQILVLSQLPSAADDLYLEGRTSGDLPIDDEDGEDDGSGSGSGDYGTLSQIFMFSNYIYIYFFYPHCCLSNVYNNQKCLFIQTQKHRSTDARCLTCGDRK